MAAVADLAVCRRQYRETLDAATLAPPTLTPMRRFLESLVIFAGAITAYWFLVP